jgi:hypothetical protein
MSMRMSLLAGYLAPVQDFALMQPVIVYCYDISVLFAFYFNACWQSAGPGYLRLVCPAVIFNRSVQQISTVLFSGAFGLAC